MEPLDDQSEGPGWVIIIGVVISLVVGLMMLLMIAGCQHNAAMVLPSGSGWLQMRSADGTYQISLKIPDQPPLNEEITVEGIVLRGGNRSPSRQRSTSMQGCPSMVMDWPCRSRQRAFQRAGFVPTEFDFTCRVVGSSPWMFRKGPIWSGHEPGW